MPGSVYSTRTCSATRLLTNGCVPAATKVIHNASTDGPAPKAPTVRTVRRRPAGARELQKESFVGESVKVRCGVDGHGQIVGEIVISPSAIQVTPRVGLEPSAEFAIHRPRRRLTHPRGLKNVPRSRRRAFSGSAPRSRSRRGSRHHARDPRLSTPRTHTVGGPARSRRRPTARQCGSRHQQDPG